MITERLIFDRSLCAWPCVDVGRLLSFTCILRGKNCYCSSCRREESDQAHRTITQGPDLFDPQVDALNC